jgi:hypothetical protein
MAAAVPTCPPGTLIAGSTLQFRIDLSDYPATDGWSLSFSYRSKAGSQIDFTAAADGAAFLVTVTAAATAQWLPGEYSGQAFVSKAAETFSVWSGPLEILVNLSTADPGYDVRTQARRTLDNIEAAIEGRATHDILNSEVEGTRIERIPIDQLLKLRDRYAAIVAAEEAVANPAARRRRRILTKFMTP